MHFYPRSPCGERHSSGVFSFRNFSFLSTLSLRRATQHVQSDNAPYDISIHALLAESDPGPLRRRFRTPHFYPRSPCGERRLLCINSMTHMHFYPRSPCGERHSSGVFSFRNFSFLSTLSLRRATQHVQSDNAPYDISIHALLAESDPGPLRRRFRTPHFYPRSPCGERRQKHINSRTNHSISIHALLAESDIHHKIPRQPPYHFYPRSPCGERPSERLRMPSH